MNNLYKRFSIGLSLCKTSENQFKQIIDEYADYTVELYFSPPFGDQFHSRMAVAKALRPSPQIGKSLYSCLQHALQKGIRLNLTLNTAKLSEEQSVEAFKAITKNLDIHNVTTLVKLAPFIKEIKQDILLTCSYNEGVKTFRKAEEIPHSTFPSLLPFVLGLFVFILLG